MFSGSVSPMTAMIDAITERTKGMRRTDFRQFSRICRAVYRDERKKLIENEVLGDYDIETYSEYMSLSKSANTADRSLYESVKPKVREMENDWSLLFAGFDRHRRAHLFTITDSGRISYRDKIGFAAIGSGEWLAQVALSSYPFKRPLPLSHAIFGIASAKFAAEAAGQVGQETILTILEPNSLSSPVFWDHTIDALRKHYLQLTRFPSEGTSIVIWKELQGFQVSGFLGKVVPLKPTIAEKVKLE